MSEHKKLKKAFFAYLKQKGMSDAQITFHKKNLDKVNSVCLNKKITKTTLWKIDDLAAVDRIISKARRDQVFDHYNRFASMMDSIAQYRDFLKERADQDVPIGEKQMDKDDVSSGHSVSLKTADNNISTACNEDPDMRGLSFSNLDDIAFTKPYYLSYNGNEWKVSTWKQVYLLMLAFLCAERPGREAYLTKIKLTSGARDLLADKQQSIAMTDPKRIPGTAVYAETNFSAIDLMRLLKKIMEYFGCAPENVIIKYYSTKKSAPPDSASKEKQPISEEPPTKCPSFKDWMLSRGNALETCANYMTALQRSSSFALEHGYSDADIFHIESADGIKALVKNLLSDDEFAEVSRQHHNQEWAALNKYLEFFVETGGHVKSTELPESAAPRTDDLQTLLAGDEFTLLRDKLAQCNILSVAQLKKENLWVFMNTYNLYSIAQRQYIAKQAAEKLNQLSRNDSDCEFVLATSGKSYTGNSPASVLASYCDTIALSLPLKIRMLVNVFSPDTGKSILCSASYGKYTMRLSNFAAYIERDISSETALKYAKFICERCKYSDEPVSITKTQIDPARSTGEEAPAFTPPKPDNLFGNNVSTERVESTVLKADTAGIAMEDLADSLHWTVVRAKEVVARSNNVVSLCDRLYHKESIIDWDLAAETLTDILDKLMEKNNGYVSSAQLYEYASIEMQMFINDNDMADQRKIFDMAQHLFEKEKYRGKVYFFWQRNHISMVKDKITTMMDLFKKFAREHGGIFLEDDLLAWLNQMRLNTANIRGQMKIYSEPVFFFYDDAATFISADSIGICPEWLEKVRVALEKLFADVGDHIVLRDISPLWFNLLPALPGNKPWTLLLLQSVLRFYDKQLQAHTIYPLDKSNGDSLDAMLVHQSSEVQTFPDAVAAFLIDGHIPQRTFEARQLRQMLVQRGMIKGNELYSAMPRALGKDPRFVWDAEGQNVTVKV